MKANLSWDLVDTKLVVTILAADKKLTFDLSKIYPDYAKMTNVQQKLIAYGVKQKLADTCAKSLDMKLTPAEMEAALTALWSRLVEGVWRIPAEGRTSKLNTAWDIASKDERVILEKLGLKPAGK